MARARSAPQTPAQAQPAKGPVADVSAAVAATELLPPEAVIVAVPVGGVITAAAAAKAVAAILGAFDAFHVKRRPQVREHLIETLTRLYPEAPSEDILRFVRDELARDRAFERNQRQRLERDLKLAMLLDTQEKRDARVRAILDREKRWTQMREKAALERAAARASFLSVKEESPEGGYWMLGQAREHTADCVAMANKFWPWEVLDLYHPQLHAGCQCSLITKDDAVRRGFMRDDQVVDVQDAIKRAAEIAHAHEMIQQAASPQEIADYIDSIMEAPFHAIYAHRGMQLRYPKGTAQGGEFLPKGGHGTPVLARGAVERALRKLIPHRPLTPVQNREIGVGEWKRLGGREVFVPEHRAFEREFDGVTYYSPPGSTHVYERKDVLRRSPAEIPHERGTEVTDTAMALRREWRAAAAATAERSLAAQDKAVLPAVVGGHPKATHSGMLDAGFRTEKQEISNAGSITWRYHHPASGATASATYHEGRVTNVTWNPGRLQKRSPTLKRPPKDTQEFLDDVFNMAHEIAAEHDRNPEIVRAEIDDRLGDTAGMHGWDGIIGIGPDARLAVRELARAKAEGRDLNYDEARGVYNAYRTVAHEVLHSAAPIRPSLYSGDPAARGIEEALTEDLSAIYTVDMLRRQGLDDVLRWLKANPTDRRVEGNYSVYRNALNRVLDVARVPPQSREDVLYALKFSFEPEQRVDGLAALLTGAGENHEQNHEQAVAWVRGLFEKADPREERGERVPFTPNVRPDLSDVADSPPAQVRGFDVHPGTWVEVKGRQGRIMRILERDGGPMFDVRFGTEHLATGDSHAVHPDEITMVRDLAPGSASGGAEVRVGDTRIKPGMTVSYLTGRGDERTSVKVERVIRAAHPDMRNPEDGWQIEARTGDGRPVLLSAERTPGLRRERFFNRLTPGDFVDPNTIPVATKLGPVTFTSKGDALGNEYHADYVARLADGRAVGYVSVAYLGDTAAIKMIEVPPEFRRKGVAAALVQRIRNEDPNAKIETLGDVSTPEGAAFVAAGRKSSGAAPTLGKRVTLPRGVVAVDSGPAVVNGESNERVRRMVRADGGVDNVIARVVAELPETLARDSFDWHPDELRDRRTPGDVIPNDQRVYIAEGAMKRGGLDGGEMLSRHGHPFHPDPEGRAEAQRRSEEAQAISGDPTLRVQITDWIDGQGGQDGHAMYDRNSHKISIRPVTDKLTFLHEIAHAMTHTAHGDVDGHGVEFQQAARDLYAKHISSEAADVFWRLLHPDLAESLFVESQHPRSRTGTFSAKQQHPPPPRQLQQERVDQPNDYGGWFLHGAHPIKTTISYAKMNPASDGHVAAWVGVSTPVSTGGPWLQIGVEHHGPEWDGPAHPQGLYVEWKGADGTYGYAALGDLKAGGKAEVSVRERPDGLWQAYLNGKEAGHPVKIAGASSTNAVVEEYSPGSQVASYDVSMTKPELPKGGQAGTPSPPTRGRAKTVAGGTRFTSHKP